ncbi:MAG: DHA2 family efflux MFS transporter permease subunit [Oenococcus sp.]|uniref:Lincomycin-resistance n=1 Tax=Oenococcus kitaharae DSM 17330 TaxID=1045004 RepID=G9WHY8_9LACO|nr:DHA2 family efflux MFS transporter permease subunit [Oenococcus kitaharae]EHN58873.1 lincomycin-resistance [Oenococcus kitaharae DSM 17330]MCV3296855.1 DHA2 family efflux MFS transporter permease subunit [Oenococcus kitaharae]
MANKQVRRPFVVILGILVVNFLGLFSETSLNIALPVLRETFSVSSAAIQWLVIAYMLMIGLALPLSTLISHWFKTKDIIIFAIFIFALGSVIAACANSFTVLLIGRTIQGIATGLFIPLMFTIATIIFPSNKFGSVMGVIGVVMGFAPVIGPTLSGIIIDSLSWRWIFWLFLPFLLLSLLLTIFTMPNVIEQTHPRVDWLSVILSMLGFGLLVSSVGLISNLGIASPIVIILILLSLLILFIYIHRQLRINRPILNFKILTNSRYRNGTLIVIFNFGIVLAAMYLLPQMLQNGLGQKANTTGWILLPAGVLNAVISVIAGRLSDRFGARYLVLTGTVIFIAGLIMMSIINLKSGIPYIISAQSMLLSGSAMLFPPAQSYSLRSLSAAHSSDGSTIMNTCQQIMGALSTSITNSLLVFGGTLHPLQNTAARFMSASRFAFIFAFVLAVLILIVAFQIKGKDKTSRQTA